MEVGDNELELIGSEAGLEEVIPESFPVKAQREFLSGELAIKLMSSLDLRGKGVFIHGVMEVIVWRFGAS